MNGLLDNRNCVHPCEMSAKRRIVENGEKNDPMSDVKNRDFGVIRFGVSGGYCVHVWKASSF
jgi:hypothetical protein